MLPQARSMGLNNISINPKDMAHVEAIILSMTPYERKHPEVLKINHINSTPIGYQFQVNLTIFVDGNMSTFASHEIANNIEKELTNLDIISLAVIHVNPMNINKKEKILPKK